MGDRNVQEWISDQLYTLLGERSLLHAASMDSEQQHCIGLWTYKLISSSAILP